MAVSGTGGYTSGLAISVNCFSSPNVHNVDFASFQPLRSQQSPSKLVLGFTHALPPFCTLTFA